MKQNTYLQNINKLILKYLGEMTSSAMLSLAKYGSITRDTQGDAELPVEHRRVQPAAQMWLQVRQSWHKRVETHPDPDWNYRSPVCERDVSFRGCWD